ncbi:carbohydrate ABC transporter permease [Clostridium neonatale]|uniref:carbohydrate ABC transporter permease n=1 Tax=Clostridium neonatale TaxID=137838 RepID=UPI00291BE64D|nr:putative ABC transporter, permease component [Clostridium neonatale]CAI3647503.1 putative ABC transporter, permease component [Clostridium neonatale]CAI3649385.1 putative ABC transporter, permease component [Clostridium neonatale]CAI3667368.1 putative ABC transporter, permease component [Clostridium neonatale]CAI3689319.1 putative ABC transporter, permease component [Clostridium neonatale]
MKSKKKISKSIIYIILFFISFVCLVPFYWMIRSSLMDMSQIFTMPPIWIPNPIKFSNYKEALTMLPFGRYFLNTLFVVVFTVLGTVITSSLCAYSFSRIEWKGRDTVFGILLTAMMIPFAVTLIPTFIGWQKLGVVNSYAPLIVPAWFGGGVFNVFLLRQFFRTIPKELDEAARIDGAGHFTIYSKIIIPLSKPSLIVVSLFSFMGSWNDFLGPLVYLNDGDKFTLSLGLMQFQGMYSAQWQYMMAAATVVLIPIVIIFFIGQKYFIEGISMSGMKG